MNSIKKGWILLFVGFIGISILSYLGYTNKEFASSSIGTITGLTFIAFFVLLILAGSILTEIAPDFVINRYKQKEVKENGTRMG